MADRTSAALFSELFTILDEALATAPGRIVIELARRVWEMSWDYDFAPEQLCCDEALARLGMARADREEGYDQYTYANRQGDLP